tara:strand:- start:12361 stop:12795 length:435 start_codon:yes stop_codon:yes gene_type:complete
MTILDYFVALDRISKTYNCPVDITRNIFEYVKYDFMKKENDAFLLNHVNTHIKRKTWKKCNFDIIASSHAYCFHICNLPYDIYTIYEIQYVLRRIIYKRNSDYRFSHYCCVNLLTGLPKQGIELTDKSAQGIVYIHFPIYHRLT